MKKRGIFFFTPEASVGTIVEAARNSLGPRLDETVFSTFKARAAQTAVIRVEHGDAVPVVAVVGEIDLANVGELDETLESLAVERGVVVSLEDATYIDSTVLTTFIRHHKRTSGHIVIFLPPECRVARVFEITRLRTFLHVEASRGGAIALAVAIRDIGAATFSRDGVMEPQPPA